MVIINALSLTKIIIDIAVKYHRFPDSIITDRRLLFISKFWSSLFFFFEIKRRLSTAFYSQTDGQTKR